jgi:hypothetical protein
MAYSQLLRSCRDRTCRGSRPHSLWESTTTCLAKLSDHSYFRNSTVGYQRGRVFDDEMRPSMSNESREHLPLHYPCPPIFRSHFILSSPPDFSRYLSLSPISSIYIHLLYLHGRMSIADGISTIHSSQAVHSCSTPYLKKLDVLFDGNIHFHTLLLAVMRSIWTS